MGAVDVWQVTCSSYGLNLPAEERQADLASDFVIWNEEVDCMWASMPCQSFSPDFDGTADQDSTATAWAPSNSAAVGDPTVPAQKNLWHREASGNEAANPGSAPMHLSVAPIRACDRCWSPHPPMCPSCMESMKQKKARVVPHEPVFRFF